MKKPRKRNQCKRISGSLAALLVLVVVGCKPQAAASVTARVSETAGINPTLTPTRTVTPLPAPTEPPATPAPTLMPTEIADSQGIVMRLIPAGPFTMGSDDGMPDEKPAHRIDLPAFYMDKYEVTNSRYKDCVDAERCPLPVNNNLKFHYGTFGTYGVPEFVNFPVNWVDWNSAKTYCEWRGARLPTEAEWEKAARGTDERKYPWGEVIDPTIANYGSNLPDAYDGALGKTSAVGSYAKGRSPYGIYDMAGNVWEWVTDWYDVYPGGDQNANSAFGQQAYRVLRGGSWSDDPDLLRTTFRGGNRPEMVANYIGIRCASTP